MMKIKYVIINNITIKYNSMMKIKYVIINNITIKIKKLKPNSLNKQR